MFSESNQVQGSTLSRRNRLVGRILLTIALLMPVQALAQTLPNGEATRLAPGDVIQISVSGRPDLSRSLTLDTAGKVPIPQVGDVGLAGLTSSEAELVLRQRMRLFDPSIDKVEVSIQNTHDNGTQFYIIGAVESAGEYTFQYIPSFWDLLRAAGGPAENGNMRQVRLIREENGETIVTQFDLSGLFEGGEIPDLELKPGDTLVVPALLDGVSAVPTAAGVKVFGAVAVPTVVDISEPTPLLDVLMLAGAPSDAAELEEIYWVHDVGDVPQARLVDLQQYLMFGNLIGNPLVYPGDTVRVEYFEESWWRRTLPLIFGFLISMSTLWLAYDRVYDD